jgi:hypothetical protein
VSYPVLLVVHSWLRWVVIALGVAASARALGGWRARRSWARLDDHLGRWFTVAFDLQVLAGLTLYLFVSPITTAAFQAPGGIMHNSVLRFWAVEHPFAMIVALALAHVGRARARRATEAWRRHRAAAIFFGLALAALLVGMPWPFTPVARPLWRGW